MVMTVWLLRGHWCLIDLPVLLENEGEYCSADLKGDVVIVIRELDWILREDKRSKLAVVVLDREDPCVVAENRVTSTD